MTATRNFSDSQEPNAHEREFIAAVDRLLDDEFNYFYLTPRLARNSGCSGFRVDDTLFDRLPSHVRVSSPVADSRLSWIDLSTGVSGDGLASIGSHIWGCSTLEAARRINRFARVIRDRFIDERDLVLISNSEAELAA